jgi:cobalamin biosynthesis Mg chelatase CobN
MNNLEYPSDLMAVKDVHVFKYADRPVLQFQCQITILVKDPGQPCGRPQCAEPSGQGDGSGGSAGPAPAPKPAKGGEASKPAASAASAKAASSASAAASPAAPASSAAPAKASSAAPAKAASSAPAKAASSAPAKAAGRKRRDVPIEQHPNAAGTMDISSRLSILDIEDQPSQLPASLSARQQPSFFDRPVILSHQQDGICMSTAGFSAFIVMAIALIAAVVTITACMLFRNNAKQ